MKNSLLLVAAWTAASLSSPAFAQSNATSSLMTYGDVLGSPAHAKVTGLTPQSLTFLVPSFLNNGSNYLVGQTGDPNDVLAVGIDLALQGHYFTAMSNAAGEATINFGIPPLSTLLDKDIYFQALSRPGGGGASEYSDFSNIRWINLNNQYRWQGAGSDLPIASANISWVVTETGSDGGAVRIFACGGGPILLTDAANPYPCAQDAWEYDLRTGETTSLAPMTTGRTFHTLTLLADGKILALGGVTYGGQKSNGDYYTNVLDEGEIYDPATNSWTPVPAMSQHRAAHGANLLPSGQVLVSGGTKGNGSNELTDVSDIMGTALRTTELYDPTTNSWTNGPNMSEPKAGHCAVTLQDDRVLVGGGLTYDTIFGLPIPDFSPKADIYDPAANSFSNAGNIGTKRALFSTCLLPNGNIAIFGGAGGDILNIGPIRACNVYDPSTTSSSSLTSLPSDRAFAGAVSIGNGLVVVMGGASGDLVDPIPQKDVWLYDVYNNNILATLPSMQATHAGNVYEFMEDGTIYVGGGESDSGLAEATAESLSL